MQITAPYLKPTARTQFNPSRMRGFYLDLREKLYRGTLTGHIKLPDSLAPIYMQRIERARKLYVARRVALLMALLGLLALVLTMGCATSTAPAYKPFVPCAVGYIRGGPDNSTCVLGTP